MAEPTGLAAVLTDAMADSGIVPPETEQLDLLGLRDVPEDKRPRGRPKGAISRRTQAIADYLLAKYHDPLEGLMQMASLGVEEMASALGCTRAEAFAEKRLCIIAALPYLHRRMPLAVDLTNHSVVHLSINTGGGAGAGEAGMTILEGVVTIEENQEVNDGVNGEV